MSPRARRALRTALAGGLAASFAMDVVQAFCARAFEAGRAADDRDEEVEAIAAVVRLLARYLPGLAGPQWDGGAAGREGGAARALHYAFGTLFAGGYLLGSERVPALRAGAGAAFGAGLFVLSDRILVPMLGLGRPWSRYSRAERFNALASHLAYGMVLEAVRRGMARA